MKIILERVGIMRNFQIDSFYVLFISIIVYLLSISLVAFLLYSSDRGIDYSDDVYSYFWARYPFDYRFALRLSGFVLHPIEIATQGSLAGLRIASITLTAASGLLMGSMVLALAPFDQTRPVGLAKVCAAVSSAFLGTMFWLPTPSYNHVSNWSLALIAAGMIANLVPEVGRTTRAACITAIGVGVVLLALSKPTAAAGLCVILLPLFIGSFFFGSQTWRFLFKSGLVALTCLALVMYAVSSPTYLVDLLANGLAVRGGTSQVWHQHFTDILSMPPTYVWLQFAGLTSIAATFALQKLWRSLPRCLVAGNAILGLGIAAFSCANSVGLLGFEASFDIRHYGIRLSCLCIGILAASVSLQELYQRQIRWAVVSFVLLLIALPWLASLGTGNNFLFQTGIYSSFYGFAILATAAEFFGPKAQVTTTLIVVVQTIATVYQAAMEPYRLNSPITSQTEPIAIIGLEGEQIRVDSESAIFLRKLQAISSQAGFSAGSPLINLTGLGPGIGLAIGGIPPVYPWIAAGYPNSPSILDMVWSQSTSQQRMDAWIMGPIHTSFSGADALAALQPLEKSYVLVGTAMEPRTHVIVELWKPRRLSGDLNP